MQIHDSVVDAIGRHAPRPSLSPASPGNLVAKVEHMNPGGSVKERIAVSMIDAAERDGLLRPGARSSNPPRATPVSVWPWSVRSAATG
jgi:cystathionine beta-synthase